jgi:hypothetical protein
MKTRQSLSILIPVGLMLSLPGCVLEDVSPEDNGDDEVTMEERMDQEYRAPDMGVDTMNGDILLGPEQREEHDDLGDELPAVRPPDDADTNGVMEMAPLLSGTYSGSIAGDKGSVAALTATFSGSPESMTANVSIADGLIFSCFGDHALGAPSFVLTGSWREGSHYTLTGSVSVEQYTIETRVEADLYDSQLNGVAHLDGPVWCDKQWPFWLKPM